MKTEQQCKAIIQKAVELANDGKTVVLSHDWGGNSLTVTVGGAHTHVGTDGGSFSDLVDGLYNVLHGGPGLSWVEN